MLHVCWKVMHSLTRFYLLEFIEILEDAALCYSTEIDKTGSYFNRDSRPSVARKSTEIAVDVVWKFKIIQQPFCFALRPSYNIQSKLISGESGNSIVSRFGSWDGKILLCCMKGTLCFMDLILEADLIWFDEFLLLFILSGTIYMSKHSLVLFSCKTLLSRLTQWRKHLSVRPPNILGLLT